MSNTSNERFSWRLFGKNVAKLAGFMWVLFAFVEFALFPLLYAGGSEPDWSAPITWIIYAPLLSGGVAFAGLTIYAICSFVWDLGHREIF